MTDAIKLAIEALEAACGNRCNAEYNPCQAREAIAALRAQPASQYLCNAIRFKVTVRNGEAMLPCLPDELGGRWVALVAAEDDCHLRAQPDHSDMSMAALNAGLVAVAKCIGPQCTRKMNEAMMPFLTDDALEGKAIGEAGE
jgi:hypothetical protein